MFSRQCLCSELELAVQRPSPRGSLTVKAKCGRMTSAESSSSCPRAWLSSSGCGALLLLLKQRRGRSSHRCCAVSGKSFHYLHMKFIAEALLAVGDLAFKS